MKISNYLALLLVVSCSAGINKTIILKNGLKISGKIKIENYDIPVINNIITDSYEEEPHGVIKRNDIVPILSGEAVRLLLMPACSVDNLLLIAANENYSFAFEPKFTRIINYKDFNVNAGYYADVYLENKYWVSNGSSWNFLLKDSDNKLIIERELNLPEKDNVLYLMYDSSPFSAINLKRLNRGQEYTFRYNVDKTDIIVIYKYEDKTSKGIYHPVSVFSVNKTGNEVKIEWTNKMEPGMYYINTYLQSQIPQQEETKAVFDYYYLE
jgi:hypothetical protein